MNKIELKIMAISRSVTQSNNYAVVLGEQDGARRLPVIIGSFEAQAIAVAIEGMEGPRPMTHDLFKNTLDTLNIELREVLINNLQEGIFFARLVLDRDGEIIEVDSRTSDALALAMRFECPIYTYEFILETAGVVLEGDESSEEEFETTDTEASPRGGNSLNSYTVGELQQMLDDVLKEENYEKAALIRDEINRRKAND
ncbi:MAG: bifunctional nuclease domain-containing protein [Bacteroidota bacterium]